MKTKSGVITFILVQESKYACIYFFVFIYFIFNLFYVDDKIDYNLLYLCNDS